MSIELELEANEEQRQRIANEIYTITAERETIEESDRQPNEVTAADILAAASRDGKRITLGAIRLRLEKQVAAGALTRRESGRRVYYKRVGE